MPDGSSNQLLKKLSIYYINISQDNFKLGGSSFGQVLNSVGNEAPTVKNASYVATVFNTIQGLILDNPTIYFVLILLLQNQTLNYQ